MKLSKKDAMIIMIALGAIAVALSIILVYNKYQEKTEALVAQNDKLQQQINDLQTKQQNQGFYETEMERMLKAIDDIYQVFPVDVREEDCILMAINQELISPMALSSISINPVTDVSFTVDTAQPEREYTYELGEGDILGDGDDTATADATAAAEANDPTNTTGMLRTRQTTFNYTVSYEGLKRSIQHVCNQTNRVAIDSLTASFDTSTGLLVGSTTLDMYLVPGQTDKPYVQPNFSAVLLGTDNIFGTIVINSESNMPDVEEMSEEGAEGAEAENAAQ